VSCGALTEDAAPSSTRSLAPSGRYDQSRFSPLWFLVAIGITAVLTAAIVMGLPMVAQVFDFEGYAGMVVVIPVWFASGVLVGLISPGKTFVEPAVATLLVAMPTAFLLFRYQTVKAMPSFMYVLMSALGVLFALVGSYVGERLQMGPPDEHPQ
jgi:amino acid transporter